MISPAASNARAIRDALRTSPGAGVIFFVRRSIAYLNKAAPSSITTALMPTERGNREAYFHTGTSILGARNAAPAKISSARESRPVYHHDEDSRCETASRIAMHPSTPSGYSQ